MKRVRICLLLGLIALLAAGCLGYRLSDVQGGEEFFQLALDNDHLVLRAENRNDKEPLYIDWQSAHLRGPRDFESPLTVKPAKALSTIYAGGRVEYELYLDHHYRGKDAFMIRRSTLSKAVVDDVIYKTEQPYELKFFVKVCQGDGCIDPACKCAAPKASWRLVEMKARVTEIKNR